MLAALERRFELLLTVPLALEYEAVLKRREQIAASRATVQEVDALVDALIAVATPVYRAFYWRPLLGAEHKLTVSFDLDVDDASVVPECDLGSDSVLNLRDATWKEGQYNKVKTRRDRRPPEVLCLVVRSFLKLV